MKKFLQENVGVIVFFIFGLIISPFVSSSKMTGVEQTVELPVENVSLDDMVCDPIFNFSAINDHDSGPIQEPIKSTEYPVASRGQMNWTAEQQRQIEQIKQAEADSLSVSRQAKLDFDSKLWLNELWGAHGFRFALLRLSDFDLETLNNFQPGCQQKKIYNGLLTMSQLDAKELFNLGLQSDKGLKALREIMSKYSTADQFFAGPAESQKTALLSASNLLELIAYNSQGLRAEAEYQLNRLDNHLSQIPANSKDRQFLMAAKKYINSRLKLFDKIEEASLVFYDKFLELETNSKIASKFDLEDASNPYLTKQGVARNQSQIIATKDGFLVEKQSIDLTQSDDRIQFHIHIVKHNEALQDIAKAYGLSVDTIVAENSIVSIDDVQPGRELSIPPIDGLTHTVAKGETLSSIVNQYKVDFYEIEKYNVVNTKALHVGTKLFIPGATRRAPSSEGQWGRPTLGVVTQGYSRSHYALDIADTSKPPIWAAADGVVEIAKYGWNEGFGNYLVIDHKNGYKTFYAQTETIYVKPGDYVSKGQAIARMGRTGRVRGATGIHLHYECHKDGIRINPYKCMP